LVPAGELRIETGPFEHEIEVLSFEHGLDLRAAVARHRLRTRVRRQDIESLVSVEHRVLAIRVRHEASWKKGLPQRATRFGMDLSIRIDPIQRGKFPSPTIDAGAEGRVLWRRLRGYHDVDYTIAVRVEGEGVELHADSDP